MEGKQIDGRTIDVKIISATDLKKVKKFGREQRCYAVAHIYPAVKQATETDNYGGVNPIWNSTLSLTCYEAHLHPPDSLGHAVSVEIFSHSSFHEHDRLVGTARLPLAEIPINSGKEGERKPFETLLDVIVASGEVRGTLNLSVKVGALTVLAPYEDPTAPKLEAFSSDMQAPNPKGSASWDPPSAPPIEEATT